MKNKNFSINFIVYSPFSEYIDYIGGATVPHTLANLLTKAGENSYIYANSTNPKYNINCINWNTDIEYDPMNTIVIFIAGAGEHTWDHMVPENLKNCPNIVRWLVNHQVKCYSKEDKFYTYHDYWNVLENQKIDGSLSVIEVDHDLFYNRGLERDGTCYLIKGNLDKEQERFINNSEDYCIDENLYKIPNLKRMEYLADLFNKKETFISYTPMTFTSVLAAMCGCKSIVIPKSSYSKDKWLNEIWCAKYGIAFGLEDLPRAIETMDLVIPNIKEYESGRQKNEIDQFITDCYDWLTVKYNIQ
jgi:hypothetical protein